jgi:hypothetical protein
MELETLFLLPKLTDYFIATYFQKSVNNSIIRNYRLLQNLFIIESSQKTLFPPPKL